jgi:hypothetical protein
MLETNYATEINKLKSMQKRDYLDYLSGLDKDHMADAALAAERRRRFEEPEASETAPPPNRAKSFSRTPSSTSSMTNVFSGVLSKVNPLKARRANSNSSNSNAGNSNSASSNINTSFSGEQDAGSRDDGALASPEIGQLKQQQKKKRRKEDGKKSLFFLRFSP